jgi:hypothetical protein
MCQEVVMKSRKIAQILGISLILTLLCVVLPVTPIMAVVPSTITLTPNVGAVGDVISLHAEFEPQMVEHFGIVYVSTSDLAVSTGIITSAPSYKKVVSAVSIPMMGYTNPGIFDCTFHIPAALTDGTVTANVTPGQYFVYVTETLTTGAESAIMAKASLTVSAPAVPTLDALSPASGPGGTSVTVSGTYFPASTAMVFRFDTTTLTPATGDTSTRSSGIFLSTITIPTSAAAGPHTISVTAGTASANATFTVTGGATIALSAASGTAGAAITVTGTGFPANTALVLRFDSTTLTPTSGSTATGTTGGFTSVITIPSGATTAAHTITAIAGTGTDSETFNVTGGGTLPLAITPNNGPIGQSVSITGNGFTVGHTVTIVWNSVTTNTTTTVLEGGVILLTFVIPPTIHGAHIISAVDSTTTANATFTVESTPPPTPQPLRPYMDEGVSSPITLDWEDVTDPSAPVTYSAQISASANFTTNLISVTGRTTSDYTLTDADVLNLNPGQTYYWREKAVDAAQNESAWTGANSFNYTQGFQFTGWILYVTIAVGVILLFLLGIWIGRKTAYSY